MHFKYNKVFYLSVLVLSLIFLVLITTCPCPSFPPRITQCRRVLWRKSEGRGEAEFRKKPQFDLVQIIEHGSGGKSRTAGR